MFEGSDALGNGDFGVCDEAADRIETLEAEKARLRLIVRGYVDPAEVKADLAPLVAEINNLLPYPNNGGDE